MYPMFMSFMTDTLQGLSGKLQPERHLLPKIVLIFECEPFYNKNQADSAFARQKHVIGRVEKCCIIEYV